jgi:predicted transcriptional regulator
MDTVTTPDSEYVQKIRELEEENANLKEQLKKFTDYRNTYYEKNKETIKQKAKEGLKKIAETNPEKIKEYARRAYLKQKEKKKQLQEVI